MDGPYVDMDKSIDPKVAEGLQIAYRARQQLDLPAEDADRIKTEIHQVAFTEFFRYPKVRLNQINWHAELYAYDWLVNDDPTLLRNDYRQHVHAFTQGFKRPQIAGGTTNVGPSYRFIYQSNTDPQYSRNIDSAEYANMTLHFVYWYDLARQNAGMAPLSGEDLRLLRGWVQRDLYGYWTHAGFMNWDTGWSYERWMKGKAWAYGQQGLLAIATSPQFQTRTREARWAKYLFDRGLRLYEHLSYQKGSRGPVPPERAALPHRRAGDARPARCSGRGWAPTPCAPSAPGWGACPPRSRRPSTPTTPTSAASPSPPATTRRRSSPPTAARSPTAATSSPASTTPTATRSAGRAATRRPPSACASRTHKGERLMISQRPLPLRHRAPAADADPVAAGPRHPPARPRHPARRRPVQGALGVTGPQGRQRHHRHRAATTSATAPSARAGPSAAPRPSASPAPPSCSRAGAR